MNFMVQAEAAAMLLPFGRQITAIMGAMELERWPRAKAGLSDASFRTVMVKPWLMLVAFCPGHYAENPVSL